MISQFAMSIISGALVGGASAYLGSLMVTKRMALAGDALGHVALPGMGLALLLNLDPSIGAFIFLLFGIYLVWRLGEKTHLSLETIVGIVFVSSLALGFLIVPQPELLEALFGDISKVSLTGTFLSVFCSIFIFLFVKQIYRGLMLINISEDLAAVEGVDVSKYNLLYLLAIALIVALGVKVTGSLLVGALVIVPPAAARLISGSMKHYSNVSIFIGVLCCVAGIAVSRLSHFPAGPTIILMGSLIFSVLFLYKNIKLFN